MSADELDQLKNCMVAAQAAADMAETGLWTAQDNYNGYLADALAAKEEYERALYEANKAADHD